MIAATTDDRWTCSRCGKQVSKQTGQHKHLRVRRADGTGWDHTRCRPPTGSADIPAALAQRGTAAGLMP
jgi:hypothetical protein